MIKNKVKVVQCFKTTDGRLYESEHTALITQEEIDTNEALYRLLKECGYPHDAAESFASDIMINRAQMRLILQQGVDDEDS